MQNYDSNSISLTAYKLQTHNALSGDWLCQYAYVNHIRVYHSRQEYQT